MTSDAVPAGNDPRGLLIEARTLARRVRVAQRVTWLPLLALAVVTFGAIVAYRFNRTVVSDCRVVDGVEMCRVFDPLAEIYWLVALALAYVVIARGYLRVARSRGLGARILPYVITGFALTALVFAAIGVGAGAWLADPQELRDPSAFLQVVFRLLTATGAIGLALLVLAWLERNVALLVFTLGYLVVVLTPINFGWGEHWGDHTRMAPQLIINGLVLLAGSAGFALAQRRQRSR